MNSKVLLLIILVSLSIVSVSALTVTLDKSPPDYRHGDRVQVTMQCTASSSIDIQNPQSQQVEFTLRTGPAVITYNTNSDSINGKYSINVRCTGDSSQTLYFCVDQAGCASTTAITERRIETTEDSDPSGSGRGGGGGCSPRWVCGDWGSCNITGQLARTCTDTRCNRQPRSEVQACTCLESWGCSEWSSCQGGTQYRTCIEESGCGTMLLKPTESQSCAASGGGRRIFDDSPPKEIIPGVSFLSKVVKFLRGNWAYVASPLGLGLLGLLAYLLLHKKK